MVEPKMRLLDAPAGRDQLNEPTQVIDEAGRLRRRAGAAVDRWRAACRELSAANAELAEAEKRRRRAVEVLARLGAEKKDAIRDFIDFLFPELREEEPNRHFDPTDVPR